MSYIIIVVISVLVIMTIVIFLILRRAIIDMDKKAKAYFTLKLEKYNDEVENKEEEKKEIVQEQKEEQKQTSDYKPSTVVYVEDNHDYEITNLMETLKKVDEKFSFNVEKVIQNFLDTKTTQTGKMRYLKLKRMQDYIKKIGVYKIIKTNDRKLEEKIIHDLRDIDEDILNQYLVGKKKLVVSDLLNYLEYEMGKCDPTVYVVVGDRSKNYNYIDKSIKTVYNPKVYKGIKIVYQNRMYDYSLS